jgi:tetratricopeptide (TPR) repeat protein
MGYFFYYSNNLFSFSFAISSKNDPYSPYAPKDADSLIRNILQDGLLKREHKFLIRDANELAMSRSDDAKVAWGLKEEGDKRFQSGDFDEAIERYDKALGLFPLDPDLWNVKGLALSVLKRYDEAIKCYDSALEHYPRDTRIWNNKGVDLANAGEHIEAIRCFDIAIDIDPQDASSWCNKGVTFSQLGWLEEAVDCFQTAIKISPQLASAWHGKGVTLLRLNRDNEARKALAMAEKLGFS